MALEKVALDGITVTTRALLSCSYGPRASRSLMIMSGPEARGPEDDEGYADGISNRQNHSAELLAKADGHV
ncbi:MAG: hypothetical protein Q8L22_15115, partial [Reyranella sp.]|nr:hypothetical protein [Reyranella sp.]